MGFHTLNQKGQIAMEYLLILVIIFSYITLIILPTSQLSINAATDVSNFSRAKFLANKLATAVDQVGSGAVNTKRTITSNIPHGVDLSLHGHLITYTSDYVMPHGEVGDICKDWDEDPVETDYRCRSSVSTLYEMDGEDLLTPGNNLEIVLEKTDLGKVTVNLT
ncbi:MAG: hypothetical protein GOV15_04410 [Candidatus Diapherotrites archaeon]|nr:hypothetical protein [Candidatus Diapherotrites archaeon]